MGTFFVGKQVEVTSFHGINSCREILQGTGDTATNAHGDPGCNQQAQCGYNQYSKDSLTALFKQNFISERDYNPTLPTPEQSPHRSREEPPLLG